MIRLVSALCAAIVGWPCAVAAQPAFDWEQLPIGRVTERDGLLYVRLMDQRRGATQATERILVNRATVLAGHWLCRHTPTPQQRLEVSLQGVHLVHSKEAATGQVEVVIRLKKQSPICRLHHVAAATAPGAEPLHSVAAQAVPLAPSASPSPEPYAPPDPQPSTGGFKTRIHSTEH